MTYVDPMSSNICVTSRQSAERHGYVCGAGGAMA